MVVVFVCLAMALPAISQEEMPDKMPMFTVTIQENVKPGMMTEYLESTKKWIEMIKSENIGLNFFAFRDMESNVHYGVPISSMAEIDDKSKLWSKAVDLLRKSDWGKKRQAAINWSRYDMWVWSPQLSYQPANPEINPQEMLHSGWANVRVSHTNEGKFNELMAKVKATYEKRGVGRGYSVYRNIIGQNGPLYVIVWGAKDPADMFKYETETWQKLGAEMKPLMDELMDLAEEAVEGRGWIMPELSLMPAM